MNARTIGDLKPDLRTQVGIETNPLLLEVCAAVGKTLSIHWDERLTRTAVNEAENVESCTAPKVIYPKLT